MFDHLTRYEYGLDEIMADPDDGAFVRYLFNALLKRYPEAAWEQRLIDVLATGKCGREDLVIATCLAPEAAEFGVRIVPQPMPTLGAYRRLRKLRLLPDWGSIDSKSKTYFARDLLRFEGDDFIAVCHRAILKQEVRAAPDFADSEIWDRACKIEFMLSLLRSPAGQKHRVRVLGIPDSEIAVVRNARA